VEEKQMTKTRRAILLLIIANACTLTALLFVSLHHISSTSPFDKSGSMPSVRAANYRYTFNPRYDEQTSLYKVYRPQGTRIVMLGDSITHGVDWNELLSRTDVANRGIPGDVTEGFKNRLPDVYKLAPEMCMIMGGINDIVRGIPVSDVSANIEKIVGDLQSHNITPVIQSTLFVSRQFPNWEEVNGRVHRLNGMLKGYAHARNVTFLDINRKLSSNGALETSFTYDGIHLRGNGYEKWRDLLLPKLQ
jgi:lysophospholipase L1-like esterase